MCLQSEDYFCEPCIAYLCSGNEIELFTPQSVVLWVLLTIVCAVCDDCRDNGAFGGGWKNLNSIAIRWN